MKSYLELCLDVLMNGEEREERTGTGTLSVFGRVLEFDLQKGFPAITTKKLFMRGVWHELLWMLKGDEYITYLKENNIRIWNEWADEDDYIGRVYGVQWRSWRKYEWTGGEFRQDINEPFVDQLQKAIDTIKNNPTDRRMLVLAWNPGELDEMKLPPCHYAFQLYVRNGEFIDIMVHQRSADVFLGLPFDIASYATLVHMISHVTGYWPGRLIYTLGDTHIYLNHLEQVHTQLRRKPKTLPMLNIKTGGKQITSIDDFEFDMFELVGYDPYPLIKGTVSV